MANVVHQSYPSRETEIRAEILKPKPGRDIANAASSIAQKLIIETAIKNSFGTMPHPEYPSRKEEIEFDIKNNQPINTYPSYGDTGLETLPDFNKLPKARISIVDYDSETNDSVELQWIPNMISYRPENKLIALASVGRNNPFYHYGGSEDSLEFTIDWFFTNDLTREKALEKARWIESLSKADGYSASLHRVKLVWGTSGIFSNSLFLIGEAPYEMKNWVDYGFSKRHINSSGFEVKQFGLLPQSVSQDILLKRVTSYNLKHSNIREVRSVFGNIITE